MQNLKQKPAFTLIEVLIALGISAIVILSGVNMYSNVIFGSQKIQLERELAEETQYTLERLVSEFRQSTVDYTEYWNIGRDSEENCARRFVSAMRDVNNDGTKSEYEDESYGTYGKCHLFYEASFWLLGNIGSTQNRTDDYKGRTNLFEGTNKNRDTAVNARNRSDAVDVTQTTYQEELYLINDLGNQKMILRLLRDDYFFSSNADRGNYDDYSCDDINRSLANIQRGELNNLRYCRLGIMKFDGTDTDVDYVYDTFTCNPEYQTGTGDCMFIEISSPNLDILDLRYFIAPVEDPQFAFSEELYKQTHPHMTIVMSTQITPRRTTYLDGTFPQMTLQTTMGSRIYKQDNV